MSISIPINFSKPIVWLNEYLQRASLWPTRVKKLVVGISILLACISAYPVLLHKTIAEEAARKPLTELREVEWRLAHDVEASLGKLLKLIGEVDDYQTQLARIPREYETAQTLAYLGTLSDATALQIRSIKPLVSKPSKTSRSGARRNSEPTPVPPQFLTQVVDLKVFGEYHQLLTFLQQLMLSRYVAVVEEIEITGDQSSPMLEGRLRLKFYFFSDQVADELVSERSSAMANENSDKKKAQINVHARGQC